MKKNLFLGRMVALLAMILCIVASSCTKENSLIVSESADSATKTLKNGIVPQPNGLVCDLIAGQEIWVGRIVYSNNGENILVDYFTENGWELSEVHLYIGNLEGLPVNKKAIQIGKFPYYATNLNGITHYNFTIPIDEIEGESDEEGFLVAAHAVVFKGDQEETAWANCNYEPIIVVKSKMINTTDQSEWWGLSDGEPFIENPEGDWKWCNNLGIIDYEGDGEYSLLELIAKTEELGKININLDDSQLLIDVSVKEGLKLQYTYVFVGSRSGLSSFVGGAEGLCPDFHSFPYSMVTYGNPVSTHSFSIPVSLLGAESMSFEEAFGSSRWGWFSYYDF